MIHISVINQLSNTDLIKIVQKVGGTNDTHSPTYQKVGDMSSCPPPPATPMPTSITPILSNVFVNQVF